MDKRQAYLIHRKDISAAEFPFRGGSRTRVCMVSAAGVALGQRPEKSCRVPRMRIAEFHEGRSALRPPYHAISPDAAPGIRILEAGVHPVASHPFPFKFVGTSHKLAAGNPSCTLLGSTRKEASKDQGSSSASLHPPDPGLPIGPHGSRESKFQLWGDY